MTRQEKIDYLRSKIGKTDGDDLERAENAFRGHDLGEKYGYSDKTKGQIIEEYRQHRAKHLEALALFEELVK